LLSDTESYGGRVRLGIAILLAVVIISSSLLAYEYLMTSSLQDQNRSLSSEVSTQSAEYSKLESSYLEEFNTSPAVESFQSYTTDIDERNVSAITTEYTPNATMEWK